MKNRSISALKWRTRTCLTAIFLLLGTSAFADETVTKQPSDLTLGNFFTEGWDQSWTKRVTPGGAPDMALLHVATNFLEREFRTDFYDQQNVGSNKTRHINFADALVAYGVNRRFMLGVTSNYQWNSAHTGVDTNGGSVALAGRFQLVDVPGASYALNMKVTSPNQGVGNELTTVTSGLAGWHDLTPLGLDRVGLYYSIQEDTFAGPAKVGTRRNDIAYDISLAKTWTGPDFPLLGNFTTFVEGYGTTDMDGNDNGKTVINATPGIRITLGHGNVLMAGCDLPITNPHAFDVTYRVTYIYNF